MAKPNQKPSVATGSTAGENADSASSVYKRIHTLFSEEKETEVLTLRIPRKYKIMYMLMKKSEKRLFKEVLIKTLEQVFNGLVSDTKNINININVVKAEAKVENKPTVDSEILQEKVRILEMEKKELKDAMKYYKKRYEQLASIVKKMPDSIGEKYVDYRKLSTLLTLVKKAKKTVTQ